MNIILLLHLFMLTFTFGHVELLTVDYHSIDTPIVELNNHTLREVFEGALVNENPYFDKPSGWNSAFFPQINEGILNSTVIYPNAVQYSKLINGNTYYYNVKRNELSGNTISLNDSFVQLGLSVYNSNANEYSNIVTPDASSNTNLYINNFVASGLNLSIQYTRYFLINLTSLDLSALTVEQMDSYFEMYQENISGDDVTYVKNEMTMTDLTYILGFAFVWFIIIWSIRKVVL